MTFTDQPDGNPTAGATDDAPADDEQLWISNRARLWWPVVQALRTLGRAASDAEITEQVADAMGLTQEQRTAMIPSGQETKLRNRVGWAVHELKEIGAVHCPEPAYRALTALGSRVEEEQVKALRAEFIQSKSSSEVDQPTDEEQPDSPAAWLIRAGRNGERYDYNIEHGLAGLGWGQMPDLRSFLSRRDVEGVLRSHLPDATDGSISNHAGQLWRLRTGLRVGDLVVMPRKGTPQIAVGVVTREYWYDDQDPHLDWRHVVSVDWQRTDVPRTALRQDLLNSLGAQMTFCAITRNDGAWRLRQLLKTGQDPGARVDNTPASAEDSDLLTLVQQFRIETGYPTQAHEEQKQLRAEWAARLSRGQIPKLSRPEFYKIAAHGTRGKYKYIYTGDSDTNRWITEMSEQRYANMLKLLDHLCWGDEDVAHRINEISDELLGTIPNKALAICHPNRFLPVGVLDGRPGMLQMLYQLGLPEPVGETYGERVVEANDQLRGHIAPHFDDDPVAIAAFLYWLMKHGESESRGHTDTPDLHQLAEELLVVVRFLQDIVSLLEDKGQVILYGPPGTGKTYLARELANALAPDEMCRALVQFHPSTSYEDFFEGYRPAGTDDGGGVRYKLTPGPLKRMAKRASKARDEQHVMIIDEINRGNLPRVLGELLFLLEYRDESVQTLYRPKKPFSLPDNLWFIGTMNTADRSIALVDAALRRRFHFVPFFPDREPMAGLLERWLRREGEPDWVGELVDGVNGELKAELEGSHLLLGPSHFMKEYGSSPDEQRERLRRIWEYNIEPFIEDQFFGDPDRIEHFRFNAVMRRHGPAAESAVIASDDTDDPESSRGSEGEHAAADGDAAAEPGSTQPGNER